MKNPHRVYVLLTGSYCKIGVTTRDVRHRVRELQTGCPFTIYSAITFSNMPRFKAFELESYIRTYLSKHHFNGEWYLELPQMRKTIGIAINEIYGIKVDVSEIKISDKGASDLSVKTMRNTRELINNRDTLGLTKLLNNLDNEHNYPTNRFLIFSKKKIREISESFINGFIADKAFLQNRKGEKYHQANMKRKIRKMTDKEKKGRLEKAIAKNPLLAGVSI